MKKQLCPLLDEAGVANDNANDGIEICTNCPYERCVYEVTTPSERKRAIRRAQVKVLCKEGKSQRRIAKLLGVCLWTVENDVKVNREDGRR